MQEILEVINQYSSYILIAMSILILILFFMSLSFLKSINKLKSKYRKLMRGGEGKNLEATIINYMDKIDKVASDNDEVRSIYETIDERLKKCVQKTSIVRYKAFENVGSDLSFSIALLNEKDSGVIITSIYGRNDSTTYAKPIDMGISRYELSEEETEVLTQAMNK